MVVKRRRRASEGEDGEDGQQSRKEAAAVGSRRRASVAEARAPRQSTQRAQISEKIFAASMFLALRRNGGGERDLRLFGIDIVFWGLTLLFRQLRVCELKMQLKEK